jgi:hypothetical protein
MYPCIYMVKEVRLLYVPFRYFPSGHICLVFTLQNDQEVVISPEAATERFLPVLGFLPVYRLRYLKLPYQQYIQKYQKANRPLSFYRLSLSDEQAISLYTEMDAMVSQLENKKIYYHILFNSCITNSCYHIQKLFRDGRCFKLHLFAPLQPKRIAVRANTLF